MPSKKQSKTLLALTTAAILAGCGAGSTGAPTIARVDPVSPSYAKLQLAVGTANLYGTVTGLNVVSTLRQPNGTSAVGVDTTTLTGPFTFASSPVPAVGTSAALLVNPYTTSALGDPYATLPNGGPSLTETSGTPQIGGTPQSVAPGTPFCDYAGALPTSANPNASYTACPANYAPDASTFGQAGGVFAMGLAPFDHAPSTGQAIGYAPYPQPIYDGSTTAAGSARPPFIPWGGPPAFDPDRNGMGTRDGLFPVGTDALNQNYFLGVAEGITAFAVTPGTGSYALTVAIGTLQNGGAPNVQTIGTTANLSSLATLPAILAPMAAPDGAGGLTFSATLPGGVTDAFVQIVDYGPNAGPSSAYPAAANGSVATQANCQGARGTQFAPVYYTVRVTASGTYALPPNDGPNTSTTGGKTTLTPSPSICTAAQNQAAGVTDSSGNPVTVGDNFTVQMIGFDYPLYQAALGLTQPATPQAPPLAGAGGQADLTLSVPVEEDYAAGGYVATPLSITRKALRRRNTANALFARERRRANAPVRRLSH